MDGAKMICVLCEFVMFWIAEMQKIGSTLGAKYSLMTGLIFDGRRLRESIIPSRRPVRAVERCGGLVGSRYYYPVPATDLQTEVM